MHEAFLRQVEAWPERGAGSERPAGLPRRVVVFGISALPRQSLEVLAALARWTQVLMCVHNPCEHYWADIVADRDLLRAEHARQQRRSGMPPVLSEENLHLHAHPLLAAWGKQGRDFIGLLDEHDSDPALPRLRLGGVLLLEPVDAAGGVHHALLAREERVALRADLDGEVALGREGVDDRAARAADLRRTIVGVSGGPGAIMLRGTAAPLPADDGLRPIFEHARGLGEKDLALAIGLGAELGVETPVAEQALNQLGTALGVPHSDTSDDGDDR